MQSTTQAPDIVDGQIHLFFLHGLAEGLACLDALGIQLAVIDEFWGYDTAGRQTPFDLAADGQYRHISPQAHLACIKHPDRFAYIQRVNLHERNVVTVVDLLKDSTGCKGIRLDLRASAHQADAIRGRYDDVLEMALHGDLAVNLIRSGADVARAIAERFPDLRVIVDHCGSPASPADWQAILNLGDVQNVYLKWGHAHHVFPFGPYPFPELLEELVRAITAYGAERVFWCSDYTGNRFGVTWSELLHYVRDCDLIAAADKEWLLSRTARAVYRLEPPKRLARAVKNPHPHDRPVAASA